MHDEFRPPLKVEWPKVPIGTIRAVVLGAVILLLLWGSFFQVPPDEMGVILRFGKFVRTAEPGLHLKLPLGIERLSRVPVQRQLKHEFGFRTARAGISTQYMTNAETKAEAIMLTGDLNVVDAEWIVQYKIRDESLFKMHD
jgi:membrane protease subunit HflK